jgi:hypothetical protein
VESLGGATQVYAVGGGAAEPLVCTLAGLRGPRSGDPLRLRVAPGAPYLFDTEGRAIARRPSRDLADAA